MVLEQIRAGLHISFSLSWIGKHVRAYNTPIQNENLIVQSLFWYEKGEGFWFCIFNSDFTEFYYFLVASLYK